MGGSASFRRSSALALLLSTSLLALGASPASAATNTPPPSAIKSPNPDTKARWGERTVAVGADVNGDSINDVWVADPWAKVTSKTEAGTLYLVSGASLVTTSTTPTAPTVIYQINPPTATAYQHFAFVISNIGDVDADGTPDLAVGVDAKTSGGVSTGNGNVWVYSGAAGGLLYTINSPTGTSAERFGSRIGKAGDIYNHGSTAFVGTGSPAVTGDGISEIIVGASGTTGGGKAYIFDGDPTAYSGSPPSSNTAVRTFSPPNSGSFGLSVQGPGDSTGDGIPDQVVSAPTATANSNANQGQMYLYDGKTGNLILTINDPSPQAGAFFGFQDVTPESPGDVNTDGKADIYAEGWLQNVGSNTAQGEAWVFAGTATTGSTSTALYSINDPHPHAYGQFGWSMTKTTLDDVATKVLYVGASPHTNTTPVNNQDGVSALFLSSNGTLSKELPLPQPYQQATTGTNSGPNLGWTVAAPGPLKSGSSYQTYIAGAPFWDSATNQDEGLVFTYWYDSVSGTYAHPYCPPTSDGGQTGTCT